ncbi:hypothetical protein EGW08_005495, partial [Elysia chlorotica]
MKVFTVLEINCSLHKARSSRAIHLDLTKCLSWYFILSSIVVCALANVSEYSQIELDDLNCTGTHLDNCAACEAGTYANEELKLCGCCTNGKGVCRETADCVPCIAGYAQPNPGQSVCNKCTIGFSTEGKQRSSKCIPCSAGYYAGTDGSAECSPCPEGTATDKEAQFACPACQEGHYTNKTGQTACEPCPPGNFCAVQKCTECKLCPKGSYTNSTGTVVCHPCWLASYQPEKGQTTCLECPAGSEA